MENLSRIEKEWLASIGSADNEHVISTIYEIRNAGSVKILPALFNMINNKTDPEVRNAILSLLSEIRSQEAVPFIVESIRQNDYGDYLPSFIASCWMSTLNFSKYLSFFAELFVREDYMTALEAFTVIEETLPNASDQEIIECIHFLRDAECIVVEEKLPLYRELRKVVEKA
jgi:hypothetical protein